MDIRSQFPIFKQKINGKPLVYFDNAATTQKPQCVIDAIKNFYETSNSNIHRSLNPLDEKATALYENSRKAIAGFIGAKDSKEVIFTRNTTESINLIVKTFAKTFLHAGDAVVLAITEHHSNIVPWLQLKKDIGIEIKYIPLDKNGVLDIKIGEELLSQKNVKMVSLAHASNALGIIHPIEKCIALAKKLGIIILIDAAQSAAHMPIDVQKLGCDFLVFSGHKMYGPTGIGVLWGRQELLEAMPEFLGGGDMITEVATDHFISKELPWKFEAGTPHISGAIGLGKAIEFIKTVGFKKIQNIENDLAKYLLEKMSGLDFLEIFGSKNIESHLPIVAFNIKGVHAHDVVDILGQEGICIRGGHHCTMPLHTFLGVPATARASLAFYNSKEEVDKFIEALKRIHHKFQG